MSKLQLLLLLIMVASKASGQDASGHDEGKWTDIPYAGDTITGHRLDIFLPDSGDGPFPIIVCVAGSAWFGNNTKNRAYQIGQSLRQKGFAIVATNHRSSREAEFPAQINDIKAVIRFLRAVASEYQLDTRFIGITGDSSGGHLSAMMGTSGNTDSYTIGNTSLSIEGSLGIYHGFSSSVDAVVDWYGPSDFQSMDSCGSSFSHNAIESPESILVGGPIQENSEMCALANPVTYIDNNDPPFLILHGDADPLVPHCQSIILHRALKSKGVQSELIIVPDGGHGEGMWEPAYINKMITFFIGEKEKLIEPDGR